MTAIFVHSDTMAIGVLSALWQAGRRVPDDIAVVSCDDIPVAEYLTPPLSTVRVPLAETGMRAVELLLRVIAGEQELGYSLDFIDHHEPGGVHKSSRIGDGSLTSRRCIQVAPLSFPALGDQTEQRALPALTCPGDENDPGIRQRLSNGRFRVPGKQLPQWGWLEAYHLIRVPQRFG